jgi:hypothetical protein
MEWHDDGMFHIQLSIVKECYLEIAVVSTRKDNNCYNCLLSLDEFIQLNKGFNIYKEINDVYKALNDYFDKHKAKITFDINNNNDTITIKCNDYFSNTNHNDITFTLHTSLTITRTATVRNGNITFISKHKHFLLSSSSLMFFPDNVINDTLTLQNKTFPQYMLIHVLSCIMLIAFMVLFMKTKYLDVNIDSLILRRKEFNILSEWIQPDKRFKYTLLYRATRDGDLADDFHRCCDRKGKTVTVILTYTNNVFGGYSDKEWESMEDKSRWKYKESNNAFLFNMKLKKKYELKDDNKNKAVFICGEDGPTFGFGHDLHVVNKCLREKSSCSTPLSYMMKERNEINEGEREFLAREVEVFLVENVK